MDEKELKALEERVLKAVASAEESVKNAEQARMKLKSFQKEMGEALKPYREGLSELRSTADRAIIASKRAKSTATAARRALVKARKKPRGIQKKAA